MKIVKILLLGLLFMLFSCETVKQTEAMTNALLGVVYDYKSNPVQGANLTLTLDNFSITVTTDVDGKFLIPELEFGLYDVEITAEKCSSITTTVDHLSSQNIFISRLATYDDLLESFKKLTINGELEFAKDKMTEIENINGKDIYYRFLKSIYFIEIESYSEAEILLLELHKESEGDPYISLLLADLYQYKLKDNDNAVIYLKKFLKKEYTEKEDNRLKEILYED